MKTSTSANTPPKVGVGASLAVESKARTPHKEHILKFLGQIHAHNLGDKHLKRIAIVGLNVLNQDQHLLCEALAQNLSRRTDWQIVFMADASVDAFRLLEKTNCHGALARVTTEAIAKVAKKLPFPVVNFSTMLKNPGVPTVCRDDHTLGELCATHLLELGFSRIGIVRPPYRDWCFHEVEAGFRQAIHKVHRDITLLEHEIDGEPPSEVGLKQFRAWIKTLPKPCALFLVSDHAAPVLMNACIAEGFCIPKDIAVIAGNYHPEFIKACHPTLTHPEGDAAWLIDAVCDHLAELMKHPTQNTRSKITVPCPGLVLGDSTDVCTSDDPFVNRALEFISNHFHEGINVSSIVQNIGCSRRHLERHFAASFGESLHEFLIKKRINTAKKLIASSPDIKLASVARDSGFMDYQAFRVNFESATGYSPSDWRRLQFPD
jgi:LacI family transcriptional regulator